MVIVPSVFNLIDFNCPPKSHWFLVFKYINNLFAPKLVGLKFFNKLCKELVINILLLDISLISLPYKNNLFCLNNKDSPGV